MADAYSKDEMNRRMAGAVSTLKSEFAGLLTGRASPALLDPVSVEAYGNHVPISQVGTISTPESRMITVQVWDKSLAKAVDKAIRDAGLGLNPQMDGQLLRIPLPELNQERRKELSKLASKYAEAARVAVRNVRRDGWKFSSGWKRITRSARTNTTPRATSCKSSPTAISRTSTPRSMQGAGNHAGLILSGALPQAQLPK